MKFGYLKFVCSKAVCSHLTWTPIHEWYRPQTVRCYWQLAKIPLSQCWIFPTGKTSFREWNITSNLCRFPWILIPVVLFIVETRRLEMLAAERRVHRRPLLFLLRSGQSHFCRPDFPIFRISRKSMHADAILISIAASSSNTIHRHDGQQTQMA